MALVVAATAVAAGSTWFNARQERARLVAKFENRERLAGLAVCDAQGTVLAATAALAPDLESMSARVKEALASGRRCRA